MTENNDNLTERLDRMESAIKKLLSDNQEPIMLTTDQAAQKMNCCVETVRRHIREGKLSVIETEHGRRIPSNLI